MQLKFGPMKSILNRIGRLIAAYSQKPPSGEPISGRPQTDLVAATAPRRSSPEASFEAKRKALGVDDSLKDIPGITTQMLVALGEHGIKSIEDLANCATDDLAGWSESRDGKPIRHTGILDRCTVSREDCDAIILNARVKAGWIK
jgi:predicted flap endonuclease-1-like 5' DNA nuclease